MTYNKVKILLIAAHESYIEGNLNKIQYIKILDDIENDLIDVDKVILKEDVHEIILQYATY